MLSFPLPRSISFRLAGALFFLGSLASGWAGSYGVDNGTVVGVLTDPAGHPIPQAWVVAQRQGNPPVIRTTRTDSEGRYRLLDLPLGGYLFGFAAPGFQNQTDSSEQGPMGAQVEAFVESGGTSDLGSLSLEPVPSQSPAQARVFVVDAVTGEPLPFVTIVIGASSASGSSQGGLSVPVHPLLDQEGNPSSLPVVIQAEGFEPFEAPWTPIPGEPQSVTFALQPQMTNLTGSLDVDAGVDPADYSQIRVRVLGIPDSISQGQVFEDGSFEVMVPASNSRQLRTFDLTFSLQGRAVGRVSRVAAPQGGSRDLGTSIQVATERTEIQGQVLSSDGGLPSGGRITQAVIVELGIAVPISGGSFHLPAIPVGRPLTLQVSVENPVTGQIETGTTSFTATNNGGAFQLPPIVTR